MPKLKEGDGQLSVQISTEAIKLVEEVRFQTRVSKNDAAETLILEGWASLLAKGKVQAPESR